MKWTHRDTHSSAVTSSRKRRVLGDTNVYFGANDTVLYAMRQDSNLSLSELRVDGNVSCNNLLMQFQADVLGMPVVQPKVTETTALRTAYLAGLAVGYWESEKEIVQLW